jgi:hypothetical protein
MTNTEAKQFIIELSNYEKQLVEDIFRISDCIINGEIPPIVNENFLDHIDNYQAVLRKCPEFWECLGIDGWNILNRISLIKDYGINYDLIPIRYDDGEIGCRVPTKINAKSRNLLKISHEAWKAINRVNGWPRLFQVEGEIIRLRFAEKKRSSIRYLTKHDIRHELINAATFYRKSANKNTLRKIYPDYPSFDICEEILAKPNPPLPALKRIVEAPFYTVEGKIIFEPGYSEESGCYYYEPDSLRSTGLRYPNPSAVNVAEAKRLLFDELLADFPFVSDAERAHALAILLHPFVREMIAGPTPNHSIEASTPGTGKTLLAQALMFIAAGRYVEGMTEAGTESEWSKRITAKLIQQPSFFLIDNVRNRLDSAALASVLTTEQWGDRILGKSKIVHVPVRCCFITTGNNPIFSTEIARRTVRIRLDAGIESPWLRDSNNFKHPNLINWIKENRGLLVWATLVLIENWIRKGKPAPRKLSAQLGMYEDWRRVMGGILEAADISGFLGNLNDFYESSDAEANILNEFVVGR